MSAFVPGGSPSGASNPFGSSGGARQFYNTGGFGQPDSGAGVYTPSASGGGSGQAGAQPPTDVQPGVVSINPLDPVEAAQNAGKATQGLLDGLGSALFGPHTGILTGGLTGAIHDDQGPLGQIGRFVGGVPGGIGDTLKNASDIVGGSLERIPNPFEAGASKGLDVQMQQPEVQAWLAEKNPADPSKTNAQVYAGDTGIAGTGLLSNADHYKAVALKAFAEAQQVKNPTLLAGKFQPPGTLADTVNYLMDGLGLIGTGWSRTLANVNRIDQLNKVGSGEYVPTGFLGTGLFAGDAKLNPAEQLAYAKMKNGEWTNDQALDFLVATGMTAHDAGLSIAISVASPDVVASFGAAGLAKAGVKGAEIVAGAERATSLLEEANVALKAAEEASNAARLTRAGKIAEAAGNTTRTMRAADKALDAAKATVEARQASLDAFQTYKSATDVSRINVLARGVQGSERVQQGLMALGRTYTGLEGTYLGRAAKLTRYLIDPMHAIDLHMPGSARMVDLYSDSLTKTLSTAMNPFEYMKNFDDFRALDKTGATADQFARDLATAMTNRGREGILSLHQASSVDRGLAGELATAEAGANVGGVTGLGLREDVIAKASQYMKQKDLLGWLRDDIVTNVLKHNWGEAEHLDLAKKLEALYRFRSAEEWMKVLPGMSKERKSLLDLAAYGRSNSTLLDAISNAKAAGHPSVAAFNLDRMVLLSKRTLTRVGADSLHSKLTKPSMTTKKALALIRKWQEDYPELAYITIDSSNPAKSVKQMVRYLEDHMESFPMQVKDDELAGMTQDLQDLSHNLGSGYQLGFRPKDQYLWGIERANEAGGKYIAKRVPWADHVGEGGLGYRPGIDLPLNIAGLPIVGAPVAKVAKVADYLGAGARMLAQQVTGSQVSELARQRFVSRDSRGVFAEAGLSEGLANKWWDRLQEYTREHQGYSGPRGFGKGDLYKAIADEGLIPQTMLNGSMRMTESDVLRMVLNAYDGDMRYIGLTQKLSGRVKKMLSAMTGYETNFAGQISEHAWPLLKFRYNPMFQLQEKIEPWVLNTQRGITAQFLKPGMSEADRATETLLQRLTDHSLIRQADLDQAEYVQLVSFGKRVRSVYDSPGTRLNKMAKAAGELMDVQGVKRINALRTFRQGLGKEMRSAWDEVMPGTWQDMKTTADAMAGHVLSEDEFAIQVLSQNLFANDITVASRLSKSLGRNILEADWGNAVKTGEWHRPTHLGEVKSLDLDHVAKGMGSFTDGTKVSSMADIRRVLAKNPEKLSEVSDFLRQMGADKDYIGRVENAFQFSWTGFWKEAEKRYSLTYDESKRLQDIMANAAEVRGMDPADFMSQVFDPGIIDGKEGLLGSLDRPLGMLRKNKFGETTGRGRSKLAGVAGESTREDLVRQISAVFSQHLDPSAKRALLMEFRPELANAVRSGKVQLHMKDIKAMWDADAEGQLADRIIGFMDGKAGTGAHDVITSDAQGVKAIRDGADKYLRNNGIEPLGERRHYAVDDAHYQTVADQYGALPEVQYEKTGRRPTTKQVYAADTDLKPQPAGIDDKTYQAYQQFAIETKAQFDFMTRPKAEGGLGIKVTVAKGDPYTPDKAGRAAMQADLKKGQLRVLGQSSDHPLLTNEQNVMFRAVHDVFGHGAEDFTFGPRGELNAAANHFKMYSAEARGPLLTETHGQTAYVNYSNDVIPGSEPLKPLDPTDPALDFEARHPFELPDKQAAGLGPNDPRDTATVTLLGDQHALDYGYTQRVGNGLRNLPPELQAKLLQPIEDLMQQFPDLRIHHIDVVDFAAPLDAIDDDLLTGLGTTKSSPYAVTFGADTNESVILFNSKYADSAYHEEDWQMLHRVNEGGRQYDTFHRPNLAKKAAPVEDLPRQSAFGAAHNAVQPGDTLGIDQIMRHEAGHAFDVARRPRVAVKKADGSPLLNKQGNQVFVQKALPGYEDYGKMMDRFEKAAGRFDLSEYGMKSGEEFAAELFTFATNPRLDMAKLAKDTPDLHSMVTEFRDYLQQVGEWKPPAAANPLAGKTIREANAIKRGTVYAPQKAGLLPQQTIDDFAQQFVGVGKHVESNPDVARTAQYFGAWSQKVLQNGLLDGSNAVHAGLLNDIARIPVADAAPYNFTEAMAHQVAVQAMQAKWQDAYRLQYFAQSRSMFERSLNHPMFGIYPASYMWGKLMPEVVRFIAQKPFGIRTGGALSASMHAQAEIALRREYDPAFDAQIEKMGHSQALSFLGYLLPTLPWDISASAPQWMKDISGQGQNAAQAVAAGQQPQDLNLVQPATDVVKKLNPMETTLGWMGKAIDEANGPNTPKEKLAQAIEQQKGPVKAVELGSPLAAVMAELQKELSK